MARELTFVPDRHCYLVRWRGDVTPEDSRRHWQALVDDPRFQRGFAALHDVRGCNLLRDFESAQRVRLVYRGYAERLGDARLAVLVDSPRQYGMERQLMTMLGVEDLGLVTYDEAEAKAWVGLPADFPLPNET
jgi:hypothetical protein